MVPSGWSSSTAMAINNLSQVAGYGDSPSGRRSFLRSEDAYEELSFPGWTSTEAVSLNDPGQVAGSGETAAGETHAFLASPAESAAADGSGASSAGSAGGGGCSVATLGREDPGTAAWVNLLVLLLPLLVPPYLPTILTRTRFLRRPSNSP